MSMMNKITERSTKAQMMAYIRLLEDQAIKFAASAATMRERISILEGEKALRTPQQPSGVVHIHGVPHNVVVERHGARVIKRFVPVDRTHLDSPVRGEMPF